MREVPLVFSGPPAAISRLGATAATHQLTPFSRILAVVGMAAPAPVAGAATHLHQISHRRVMEFPSSFVVVAGPPALHFG